MTFDQNLHENVTRIALEEKIDTTGKDNPFYVRLMSDIDSISHLYREIYGQHQHADSLFESIIKTVISGYKSRESALINRDEEKSDQGTWFLSNELMGMSLYVDRFAGDLKSMPGKLPYFEELGVNFLHLMPIFESPAGESDGGYAVSDFRKVESRFGSLEELIYLGKQMREKGMYLMLDIVLNHTSHRHQWAEKAKSGDKEY